MFDRLEDILIAAKESIFRSKIKKALFFIVVFYFLASGCNRVMQYAWSEVVDEYLSPNGKYAAVVYYDSGGLLSNCKVFVRVKVKNLPFLSREIYYIEDRPNYDIEWINNNTVEINMEEVNIFFGHFDSRNHPEMYE